MPNCAESMASRDSGAILCGKCAASPLHVTFMLRIPPGSCRCRCVVVVFVVVPVVVVAIAPVLIVTVNHEGNDSAATATFETFRGCAPPVSHANFVSGIAFTP